MSGNITPVMGWFSDMEYSQYTTRPMTPPSSIRHSIPRHPATTLRGLPSVLELCPETESTATKCAVTESEKQSSSLAITEHLSKTSKNSKTFYTMTVKVTHSTHVSFTLEEILNEF